MNERPVLKVKLVAEDVTLEQICDLDTLFNQCDEIVLEQKEEDVRVLVLLNVLDNHVCRANLVAFERDIKGCRDFDARIIVLLVLYPSRSMGNIDAVLLRCVWHVFCYCMCLQMSYLNCCVIVYARNRVSGRLKAFKRP